MSGVGIDWTRVGLTILNLKAMKKSIQKLSNDISQNPRNMRELGGELGLIQDNFISTYDSFIEFVGKVIMDKGGTEQFGIHKYFNEDYAIELLAGLFRGAYP